MPANGSTLSLTQENCAAYGQPFGCGASTAESDPSSCWCREIKLSEAALGELRDRFAGCLCQNCLLAFAKHPADELSNDAASIANEKIN